MWKNTVQSDNSTDNNIIRRMRFACWVTKTTYTHAEYVILIDFPRQQWLRERASMLRYTYTAALLQDGSRADRLVFISFLRWNSETLIYQFNGISLNV